MLTNDPRSTAEPALCYPQDLAGEVKTWTEARSTPQPQLNAHRVLLPEDLLKAEAKMPPGAQENWDKVDST